MMNSSSDPKLIHLVRKFLSFSEDSEQNVDHIVRCLRSQHREYQRKDLTKLKKQVHQALKHLEEADAIENPKPNVNDDKGEVDYDIHAKAHDEQRKKLDDATGGGSLNASLIAQYRKLQQNREEAAAVEAAIGPTNVQGSEPTAVIDDGRIKKRSREDGGISSGAKATHNDKNGKSSKRKKSLSKRQSSSAGLDATNTGDGATVSEAVPRPTERYTDLGGMEDVLRQIRQLVEYPLVRPELYRHLGVDPPRGVLLRGPPGCGKTHLANSIAGELDVPYFRVSAPELVSGMSGESEARIRELFQAASDSAPSIVFLDELDAIAPKRSESGSSRGMEKRMVAQLLTCMDMLDPKYNRQASPVIVLGATNRSDSIDPALRRAGRFDKEILLGVPDEEARIGILKTMTKDMKLDGDFDFKVLARRTPGYVGADVRSLTKEAAVIAINRIFKDVLKDQKLPSDMANGKDRMRLGPLSAEEMEPLFITMEDFLEAIPLVQPSSKREGFATVPDVSWDDIGALNSVREELTLSVLEPIRNPEKFQALGIPLPAGVMLYGPPGCGKTLLAKAIANESGANFISVKGPELLDKYVGESERSVRVLFERARASSPCVVFFDELDSLCPKRGNDSSGGGVSERVVNQLLTEMDGLESRRSIFVIAATNRPELIDPAMMRPGRLDKLLYVPLPTPKDRVSILKALSGGINLSPEVDLEFIGSSVKAEGYSGADCAALLREAGLAVLKEDVGDSTDNPSAPATLCILPRHFDYAFQHVVPSVSKRDQARYNKMRDRMAHARSRGAVVGETSQEDGDPTPEVKTEIDIEIKPSEVVA
ncbi:AAA ATPase domain containing protein [Nitzschia inconspicua]|uniref:AAA ATPase domain containing protein n=1 Tax=Nitzschia inconspicua TaxID=303405 RepID=A0A9K3PPN1_9STRA|nr:AAA ATPase domain containing protein [Nitzschia inconspicua]